MVKSKQAPWGACVSAGAGVALVVSHGAGLVRGSQCDGNNVSKSDCAGFCSALGGVEITLAVNLIK